MVGVFIDTVIVCSATALIILVTESYMDPALKGAQVTQAAFSIAFGGSGSVLLAICLTFFEGFWRWGLLAAVWIMAASSMPNSAPLCIETPLLNVRQIASSSFTPRGPSQ